MRLLKNVKGIAVEADQLQIGLSMPFRITELSSQQIMMGLTYESSPFAADGLGIAGMIWYQVNDLNRDTANAKIAVQEANSNAQQPSEVA